jgi:hypothetical protein
MDAVEAYAAAELTRESSREEDSLAKEKRGEAERVLEKAAKKGSDEGEEKDSDEGEGGCMNKGKNRTRVREDVTV